MRCVPHRRFAKEIKRLPPEVRQWTVKQIAMMEAAPDAATASVGASKIKGAPGVWVRKFRRKPHGDYRLVFFLSDDEVEFRWCGARESGYKTALRRAKK